MSGKTCTLTDPEREMVKRNSLIGGSDDDYDDYEDFDDGDAKSSGHPGNPTTGRRRSGGIVRGKWKASMREMRMICDFKVRSKKRYTRLFLHFYGSGCSWSLPVR